MSDDLKPWDRQPGETSKAYAAFQTYLDQGVKRSYTSVAKELGRSGTWIEQWGKKHRWPERAAAWDSMPRRAVAEAYEEMAQRIAAQHERLATKLMARLERNLDLLPEGTDPSMRWSTAHGAARQGHALATDLSKPKDTAREEISKQIAALITKLAGEE